MRIEQLEYVTAIARAGSFRQAAKELHISQPALSQNVRKLERELGVDLLDRRASGARFGENGRLLLPHMLAAIEAIEALRLAADEAHEGSRLVRVGTVAAATVPIIAPTIGAFREIYPNTEVELVSSSQAATHRALIEGSMDLALMNYLEGDPLPDELDSTRLLQAHPVVCIRSDGPLAGLDAITNEQLRSQPLIAMRSGYLMRRVLQRLLGEEEPKFAYSADGAEMAKAMVSAGLGVALLAEYDVSGHMIEPIDGLTYRPLAEDDTSFLLMIHRHRSSSTRNVVSELHQLFVDQASLL